MTEMESEQAPTSDESWYCPECGRRYPGPGTCAVQHPPTQLREVATDSTLTEEPTTEEPTSEEPTTEEPTASTPINTTAEAAPPTASQQAQSLVAAIKSHADDLATLLAGL
jgi:hypothetical protein